MGLAYFSYETIVHFLAVLAILAKDRDTRAVTIIWHLFMYR